jgi:hypothetical protein
MGVHSAGPEAEAFNSMLLEQLDHGDRCAEVERCAVVSFAQDGPDPWFHKPEPIVVKVLGKICVVGDDEREMKGSAIFSASVIEGGYAKQRGIGDVEKIGFEFIDCAPHGGARQGKAKLRIEEERAPFDADNPGLLKMIEAAFRGKDEDLVTEAFQLVDSLAEGGDDAIHFGNEGFSEEGNSHDRARLILLEFNKG